MGDLLATHRATFDRVRAEYLEMPGLRLTIDQARRLLGLEHAMCQSVLDALVEDRFLCVTQNGQYARADSTMLP